MPRLRKPCAIAWNCHGLTPSRRPAIEAYVLSSSPVAVALSELRLSPSSRPPTVPGPSLNLFLLPVLAQLFLSQIHSAASLSFLAVGLTWSSPNTWSVLKLNSISFLALSCSFLSTIIALMILLRVLSGLQSKSQSPNLRPPTCHSSAWAITTRSTSAGTPSTRTLLGTTSLHCVHHFPLSFSIPYSVRANLLSLLPALSLILLLLPILTSFRAWRLTRWFRWSRITYLSCCNSPLMLSQISHHVSHTPSLIWTTPHGLTSQIVSGPWPTLLLLKSASKFNVTALLRLSLSRQSMLLFSALFTMLLPCLSRLKLLVQVGSIGGLHRLKFPSFLPSFAARFVAKHGTKLQLPRLPGWPPRWSGSASPLLPRQILGRSLSKNRGSCQPPSALAEVSRLCWQGSVRYPGHR
jgi:hypothetical protein